jgi:DNA-directed RNA polymerase specialized sigma24 family protein
MSKLDVGSNLPFEWDWPQGIPEDYDSFARGYKDFVLKYLSRINKVERNAEDLAQDVWLKLVSSKVLEKFVDPNVRRLPSSMTVQEAIRFLGVSNSNWFVLLSHIATNRDLYSYQASLALEVVLKLDSLCKELGIPQGRKVRPTVPSRGFKSYLTQAVHNAYANFCRSRERRYSQEHMFSPQASLNVTTSGTYHQGVDMEGGSSWEASLTSAMILDEEDNLDSIRSIQQMGVDQAIKESLAADATLRRVSEIPEAAQDAVELVNLFCHQHNNPDRGEDVKRMLRRGQSLEEIAAIFSKRNRFDDRMHV